MNNKEKQLNVMLTTLGCKVNQYESASLDAELQHFNCLRSAASQSVDVCIINTCTVTQKASMQSRQAIRKAIKENPDAIILATGCYAQSEPQELKKIKGLDYIVANSDKHRISQIIRDLGKNAKPKSPVILHKDIRKHKDIPKSTAPLFANRTRPFIKVQDGCDNFCSYCIVPYTRGPSRSVSPETVLHILHQLPPEKKKEVVLTGIHLGKYGADLMPVSSLYDLLKRIQCETSIQRIRLSSIEPIELSDALIHLTEASPRICRHFHIPLQSGDPQILKKMNRPYDVIFFEKLIEKIHRTLPDAAIGIDIMVGFPGETEAAFKNTFDLIQSLPVSYLHVFPFSSRPGTKASTFPDPVQDHVIKKRRDQLLDLGRKKKAEFYRTMHGKVLEVLFEEKIDSASGRYIGFSANYVRVLAEGDDSLKNNIVPCRIRKMIRENAVLGECKPR